MIRIREEYRCNSVIICYVQSSMIKRLLTVDLVSCFHFIIKEEVNQNDHTTEVSENCKNERENIKIGKIKIINSFDLIC